MCDFEENLLLRFIVDIASLVVNFIPHWFLALRASTLCIHSVSFLMLLGTQLVVVVLDSNFHFTVLFFSCTISLHPASGTIPSVLTVLLVRFQLSRFWFGINQYSGFQHHGRRLRRLLIYSFACLRSSSSKRYITVFVIPVPSCAI